MVEASGVVMARTDLAERFVAARARTLALIDGLTDADATVQSMADASPAKWHLAHTTWFFEEFVLAPHLREFRYADPRYRYLFNSYYEAVGARHPRPARGLLTRPRLDEVVDYRWRVDAAMRRFIDADPPAAAVWLIELGVAHEQQHQELLLTDILHLFAQNPLQPVYREAPAASADTVATPVEWIGFAGGLAEVGHRGPSFAFDCETPRHRVLLAPYALANRPVTNRDWIGFIDDGGYRSPLLWLSDGWAIAAAQHWEAPLYWRRDDGEWRQMTLGGEIAVEPDAPVAHVSYFEADAYARWALARLPTEFEWEAAAWDQSVSGRFADSGPLRPAACVDDAQRPLRQLYGDVWEWTASAFAAYPGFCAANGAVGEYNAKFMCGQQVLRGGSCATPAGHLRPSYRNFFYPHQRWQFSGLRLARDRH